MDTRLRTELPAGFDLAKVRWARFVGSPKYNYPIDYAIAIIEADVSTGRIDYLARWQANSYCHYHRHLGTTAAVVLEGEQRVSETHGHETVSKVRRKGFKGSVPDGETHMECAGPDGLTMMFSTHAPDGRLFQVLDPAGNVVTTATIGEFVQRLQAEAA